MNKILKNKKKKGFTLIEIIAVVAIIAILAAVLIPKVMGYMREAKKTEAIDESRKVVTAAEALIIKGQTPATVNGMTLSQIVTASGGLLDITDLDKINNVGSMTVQDCRNLTDSAYQFSVDDDGKLKAVPAKI